MNEETKIADEQLKTDGSTNLGEASENNEDENQETTSLEPTLKMLQAEAIELGMPKKDAESIKSKSPLIAVINMIKAKDAEKEVELDDDVVDTKEVKKVKSIEEVSNPAEEREITKIYMTKAEKMRSILEAQPKVRFFLPIAPNEKPGVLEERIVRGRKEYFHVGGSIETVQLNGYKTLIPKGVFVEIPQQVAEVLAESMQSTQQAGADFLIDRQDPKTGNPVSDQLL